MTELPKAYDFREYEDKIYQEWEEKGYFKPTNDPNLPGHEECMLVDPATQHQLLFIEVPDTKSVKNRLHFDLRPREGTRDEEVHRPGLSASACAESLTGPWRTRPPVRSRRASRPAAAGR